MEASNVLESKVPFSQSIIWELNRSYYQEEGLAAWSDGIVPHDMTSSAFVGKSYAALIVGFLKDLAAQKISGASTNSPQKDSAEKVYLVELGSGHGRFAFHLLQQLEHLIALESTELPPYCLVVTDIIDSSLDFFMTHPQFEKFAKKGQLDVAYFDAVSSKELVLKHAQKTFTAGSLSYPIIGIANYFLDSLPNELYSISGQQINPCEISVFSELDPATVPAHKLIANIRTAIHKTDKGIQDKAPLVKKLMEEYTAKLNKTYLLIPEQGFNCIDRLKSLSKTGLLLITMDKGFSDLKELDNRPQPEVITHGSLSLYVNYHAMRRYCELNGGKSFFSSFSDFSLQMGCLLFVSDAQSYHETARAYEINVNDFGPDDYLGIKKFILKHREEISLREIVSTLRLGYYDSTLFLHLLPAIKRNTLQLTIEEQKRLAETLTRVGANYFSIKEPVDITYEIAGLLYDMGHYTEALKFFNQSALVSGELADLYYNKILCYYQLRQDSLFSSTLATAKLAFPDFTRFADLEKLDLAAV